MLNLTIEQKLAILCHRMAFADGNTSDAEKQKVCSLAKANELNMEAVFEAWNEDCENPVDMYEVLDSVTDEDERDFLFFAVGRMAAADNILGVKEMNRMFQMAEAWEWAPGYVVIMIVRMLRQYPDIKVEGVD